MRKNLLLILFAITMVFAISCEENNQDAGGLQDGACETREDCGKDEFCNSGYCKADSCANAFCGTNSTECERLSETEYKCICKEGFFENASQNCVTPCDANSCGTGTYCRATSATEFECGCQVGYQDNDNDGNCSKDCATSGLSCDGANTRACDDSTGTALCACESGYQDNDANGTCEADCDTTTLADCTGDNKACDDTSGTAICGCETGYQDNDNNQTCDDACGDNSCTDSNKGKCDDASGVIVCACDDGTFVDGANCVNPCDGRCTATNMDGCTATDATTFECACKTGFFKDANQNCVNPCDANLCFGAHVTGCTATTAIEFACTCEAGSYENDSHKCINPCDGIDCGTEGTCIVLGEDSKQCNCSNGYHPDTATGLCVENNLCEGISCGTNGFCEMIEHVAVCNCESGYDANGGYTCSDVNECSTDPCDTNAVCENTEGSYTCTCKIGYIGNGMTCADVNKCSDDTDECTTSQSCKNYDGSFYCLNCECNGDKVIDNTCADETKQCNCKPGYKGLKCDEGCEAGYYEENGFCYEACVNMNCGVDHDYICGDTGGILSKRQGYSQ